MWAQFQARGWRGVVGTTPLQGRIGRQRGATTTTTGGAGKGGPRGHRGRGHRGAGGSTGGSTPDAGDAKADVVTAGLRA